KFIPQNWGSRPCLSRDGGALMDERDNSRLGRPATRQFSSRGNHTAFDRDKTARGRGSGGPAARITIRPPPDRDRGRVERQRAEGAGHGAPHPQALIAARPWARP